MATAQTDKPTETVEELLEKANRATLEKKQAAKIEPTPPPLSAEDMARIEGMDRVGLVALYRLLMADKVHYSLLTKEEKREAMKLKVYSIAMQADSDAVTLKAANDWLDREDGKATAYIKQDVNVSGAVMLMTGDQVASLISGWTAKRNEKTIEHINTTL